MTPRPRIRIEYILILLSALSFGVTALCTSRMNRAYSELDGRKATVFWCGTLQP